MIYHLRYIWYDYKNIINIWGVINMHISLSSGSHDIISSGQTFLFDKDDIFRIKIEDDNTAYIELVFVQTEDKEQDIKTTIEENTLRLTCYNFAEEGTGLSSPWRIMSSEGKNMYFMFWSHLEGKTANVRVVKYTLFMGE